MVGMDNLTSEKASLFSRISGVSLIDSLADTDKRLEKVAWEWVTKEMNLEKNIDQGTGRGPMKL